MGHEPVSANLGTARPAALTGVGAGRCLAYPTPRILSALMVVAGAGLLAGPAGCRLAWVGLSGGDR
jgi:hypothetical protein